MILTSLRAVLLSLLCIITPAHALWSEIKEACMEHADTIMDTITVVNFGWDIWHPPSLKKSAP